MKPLLRWLILCAIAALALQIYFVGRIATMAALAPQSTAFERSEAWRIAQAKGALPWRQEWADYDRISDNLKRAVIASEDDGFSQHDGVDWEALEKAWAKNAKAEQKAEQRASQGRAQTKPAKVVGGFSSSPNNWRRTCFYPANALWCAKGQEFVLTLLLEHPLSAAHFGALPQPRGVGRRRIWRRSGRGSTTFASQLANLLPTRPPAWPSCCCGLNTSRKYQTRATWRVALVSLARMPDA
ncbi:MAG: transglycosylase domain-containing protein [Rhodococcus sp. (in: high G+C Gram-positive bacteria)]|uniref:transglycosylase domain-containing protein n=1 Tax=Rhodococcus sp. TaxID=1831 RepID=UPI002AD82106|nr:transglycosylase domain-containing protein [Rhodococcus sp. (in: high G+C Gram-positive bacteria)]